jgi:UDP-glucose 4-epimerase
MKRVLVTGGRGYIGARLVERLRRDGMLVRVLSHSGDSAELDVEERRGDLRDPSIWPALLADIDAVVHLAAQTSVYVAERDPIADAAINVMPVLALLEACKAGPPRTIVLASTATVVGLPTHLPVGDDVVPKPVTTYDTHKLMAEQYLALYARLGVVTGCALRLGNVYGPGPRSKSADRGVINQMVRRAINGEPLSVYGSGEYVRDYVYIDDVVDAFVRALHAGDQLGGRAYLIGSGAGRRLVDAITTIGQITEARLGRPVAVTHVDAPANLSPIEFRNFIADTKAFQAITDWRVTVSFETGIERTLEAVIDAG